MFNFNKKLKLCRQGVLEWRKKKNLNLKSQIENIKRQLEGMEEAGGQRDWNFWNNLKYQLEEAYKS